jgi:hypothetical protein
MILALIGGTVVGSAGPGRADTPLLRPGELFYQFRDEVVLWSNASTRWGRGPYRLEDVPTDRSDYVIATRAVDVRLLPPLLSAWQGRALRLYAWDGSSCTAKVTGLRLVGVARLVPPLATQWSALRDPAKGDPTTGDPGWQEQSAMAEAAWNHGAHLLVAKVDRQGSCTGDAWARGADLPAPALATNEPISDTLYKLAVDAFRALPEWQRLQQLYTQAPDRRGQPDPSWDSKNHARPRVQVFRLLSGGAERRFISVHAVRAHTDAASDRRLWAIFEVAGTADRPTLSLRDMASDRAVPAGTDLHAVVDLHKDGGLAFLYGSDAGNGLMIEAAGALVEQPLERAPR